MFYWPLAGALQAGLRNSDISNDIAKDLVILSPLTSTSTEKLLLQPPREGGLPRRLGARSRCFCCLDPIPPTEGGGTKIENRSTFPYITDFQAGNYSTELNLLAPRAPKSLRRAVFLGFSPFIPEVWWTLLPVWPNRRGRRECEQFSITTTGSTSAASKTKQLG